MQGQAVALMQDQVMKVILDRVVVPMLDQVVIRMQDQVMMETIIVSMTMYNVITPRTKQYHVMLQQADVIRKTHSCIVIVFFLLTPKFGNNLFRYLDGRAHVQRDGHIIMSAMGCGNCDDFQGRTHFV